MISNTGKQWTDWLQHNINCDKCHFTCTSTNILNNIQALVPKPKESLGQGKSVKKLTGNGTWKMYWRDVLFLTKIMIWGMYIAYNCKACGNEKNMYKRIHMLKEK